MGQDFRNGISQKENNNYFESYIQYDNCKKKGNVKMSIDAIKEKNSGITIAFPIYSAVQCALLVVYLPIVSDKSEN